MIKVKILIIIISIINYEATISINQYQRIIKILESVMKQNSKPGKYVRNAKRILECLKNRNSNSDIEDNIHICIKKLSNEGIKELTDPDNSEELEPTGLLEENGDITDVIKDLMTNEEELERSNSFEEPTNLQLDTYRDKDRTIPTKELIYEEFPSNSLEDLIKPHEEGVTQTNGFKTTLIQRFLNNEYDASNTLEESTDTPKVEELVSLPVYTYRHKAKIQTKELLRNEGDYPSNSFEEFLPIGSDKELINNPKITSRSIIKTKSTDAIIITEADEHSNSFEEPKNTIAKDITYSPVVFHGDKGHIATVNDYIITTKRLVSVKNPEEEILADIYKEQGHTILIKELLRNGDDDLYQSNEQTDKPEESQSEIPIYNDGEITQGSSVDSVIKKAVANINEKSLKNDEEVDKVVSTTDNQFENHNDGTLTVPINLQETASEIDNETFAKDISEDKEVNNILKEETLVTEVLPDQVMSDEELDLVEPVTVELNKDLNIEPGIVKPDLVNSDAVEKDLEMLKETEREVEYVNETKHTSEFYRYFGAQSKHVF